MEVAIHPRVFANTACSAGMIYEGYDQETGRKLAP
jgi:hypothetical protein